MEKVYVIVFRDGSIQLYPRDTGKENFNNAKCYSCKAETSIDDVREFVYSAQCDIEHGHFKKIFKKEW